MRSLGDEAVEIEAHGVIGNAAIYFDAENCLNHLDRVIDKYDPGAHGASPYRLGPDPGVVARITTAVVLWEVGMLDSAVARAQQALDFAARIEHPYSLAYALFHCGFLAISRDRFEDVLTFSARLAEVSDNHDYLLWRTLATVLEGVARTALGEPEEGVALTEQGVDLYQGLAPPPIFWPLVLGLPAEVHARPGSAASTGWAPDSVR